jgi:hypothetical protein
MRGLAGHDPALIYPTEDRIHCRLTGSADRRIQTHVVATVRS